VKTRTTFLKLHHSNIKFEGTVMNTVIGVLTLRTGLFTLLHNIFRLLSNNGHNMTKRTVEINLYLRKRKTKEDRKESL
jgi:uncharacterized protein YqgV (UPF0045/DUF77 family)